MGMINTDDVKWIQTGNENINKISKQIENIKPETNNTKKSDESKFTRMKNFVKKAVNCCIE